MEKRNKFYIKINLYTINIMEELKNQFFLECGGLLRKIIKQSQDNINNAEFNNKSVNDILTCCICRTQFKRRFSHKHHKTNKHIKKTNELLNQVINLTEYKKIISTN